MVSRKGTLLERSVGLILESSGFRPELNKIIGGYEIDVFLKHKGYKIAFECKQYERSNLAVRNLIHQWDSKSKEIGIDKVVLVITGSEISSKDYDLAKKYGIVILDESQVTNLLDGMKNGTNNFEKVLRQIGISDPRNGTDSEYDTDNGGSIFSGQIKKTQNERVNELIEREIDLEKMLKQAIVDENETEERKIKRELSQIKKRLDILLH